MVAVLPQLKQLDGLKIENSERILALQRREVVAEGVAREELRHVERREREREEYQKQQAEKKMTRDDEEDAVERRKKFFAEKSPHCPETKLEMQKVMAEIKDEKEQAGQEDRIEKKEPRRLFMRCGQN